MRKRVEAGFIPADFTHPPFVHGMGRKARLAMELDKVMGPIPQIDYTCGMSVRRNKAIFSLVVRYLILWGPVKSRGSVRRILPGLKGFVAKMATISEIWYSQPDVVKRLRGRPDLWHKDAMVCPPGKLIFRVQYLMRFPEH